ncbi:hypothetical protein [Mucilaginibacter sp. KACC 22063]|uniref:hypothetical protein n=1 Tax=Mucilaginibacter sp. KACC 22063 TaxID=3025666 RepID=UPI003FD12CE4
MEKITFGWKSCRWRVYLNDRYYLYRLNVATKKHPKNVIRDIWTQKDVEKNVSFLSLEVPPHGVKLIKVAAK